jgi:hypothetical protein
VQKPRDTSAQYIYDSLGCTGFLLRDLFGERERERRKKVLLLFKINLWEESEED